MHFLFALQNFVRLKHRPGATAKNFPQLSSLSMREVAKLFLRECARSYARSGVRSKRLHSSGRSPSPLKRERGSHPGGLHARGIVVAGIVYPRLVPNHTIEGRSIDLQTSR